MGTFMEGVSVYEQNLPKTGVIVLGNEANGISKEIEALDAHAPFYSQIWKIEANRKLSTLQMRLQLF